ncbi:UNVERIFIED_CONTAM: hypothetical protein Sindi_1812900 [Sesamum indicum]
MVSSKKRIPTLSKRDRGICCALGDALTLYRPVATVIGRIQKRGYDFIKNEFDCCVYKKISGSTVAYLVLYVDNILLIGDGVKMLGNIKAWFSTQFSIKDIGDLLHSWHQDLYGSI